MVPCLVRKAPDLSPENTTQAKLRAKKPLMPASRIVLVTSAPSNA
jgi:hypothetical protein